MRELGLTRAGRGRVWTRRTRPEAARYRPRDLVQWRFAATRPNRLSLAEVTDVETWRGFVYVALVIDVFARRIVGWRASSMLRTDVVHDALEQALYLHNALRARPESSRSQ
jgi:putative transposase